jgi:hypothetical protein
MVAELAATHSRNSSRSAGIVRGALKRFSQDPCVPRYRAKGVVNSGCHGRISWYIAAIPPPAARRIKSGFDGLLPGLIDRPAGDRPSAPDRILFTVGGFRYPDAEASGRGTYFDLMRKGFKMIAA